MAEVRRRQPYDYYNYANHYNNSSSAVEVLPEETVIKRPKRSRRRGTRVITEDATDKSARPSVLVFIAMGIITIGAAMSLLANSFAGVQGRENSNLRSQLQAAQSRTNELTALAAGSIDMEEVERVARTRLGMSEPQMHQIRHISIPRNYTLFMAEAVNTDIDTDTVYYDYQLASTGNGLISLINIFIGD